MVIAIAIILGIFGCERSPDLSPRAEEVGDVLAAMPGAEQVETIYKNYDSGRNLNYVATMTVGATDDEAIQLASTLNNELGSEFEHYNRGLTIRTADFTADLREETAVETLRQLPTRLRALASSPNVDRVTWKESEDDEYSDDVLEISGLSGSPFDVFTAVRDEFGSDEMLLRLNRGRDVQWSVAFPYSVQAQDSLESALGDDLKEVLDLIIIEGDHLTNLTVTVAPGPDVVGRLEDIIDLADSGASVPWSFDWSVGPSSSTDSNLLTGGSISVGSCDYASTRAKETDPSRYMTTEAIAVQDQLRDVYDTCR